MSIIDVFVANTWLLLLAVTLFSLCVGSFLNVVIYRLPKILERDWLDQCHEYLDREDQKQANEAETGEKLSLSKPRSACPACGHQLSVLENIPVLSYFFLGGKCSSCKSPISIQYPFIESLTAVLSVLVAIYFGPTATMLAALFLTWSLIALAVIDLQTTLLPDVITLPLLWVGILLSYFELFTTLNHSVIGAMVGYMSLWIIYQAFKLLTGKEGMGFGDFKLLAAIGAWFGWMMLPQVILISSLVGLVFAMTMIVTGKTKRDQVIPFGPYLAFAAWVTLIWGEQIQQFYMTHL